MKDAIHQVSPSRTRVYTRFNRQVTARIYVSISHNPSWRSAKARIAIAAILFRLRAVKSQIQSVTQSAMDTPRKRVSTSIAPIFFLRRLTLQRWRPRLLRSQIDWTGPCCWELQTRFKFKYYDHIIIILIFLTVPNFNWYQFNPYRFGGCPIKHDSRYGA